MRRDDDTSTDIILRLYGIGCDTTGLELEEVISGSHTLTHRHSMVVHHSGEELDGTNVRAIVEVGCATRRA